jgi:hypothetical protein
MLCRAAVLALCLGAACGRSPGIAEVGHDCSNLACRPTTTVSWTGSYGVSPLDFLLVVDDSVPAGPAQGALSQAMRDVAENVYEQLQDSHWAKDIHVAVVPANLASNSTTRLWPPGQACPQLDRDYLQTTEICGRAPNFTGPLADLLDCAGTHLGSSGQPSRPMETIRALLTPGGLGETMGFRRPSARFLLGLVSTTDDPDLATEAGQADYRDFLLGAVPDSDALELAIVAPADAQGLKTSADLFGASAIHGDLAGDSWDWLSSLGGPVQYKLQYLCIEHPVVDLAAPGSPMQPLCFVIRPGGLRGRGARGPEAGRAGGRRPVRPVPSPARLPVRSLGALLGLPAGFRAPSPRLGPAGVTTTIFQRCPLHVRAHRSRRR